VSIREQMDRLRSERDTMVRRINQIENEMHVLQTQCQHPESSIEYGETRLLEPRWAYPQLYNDYPNSPLAESRRTVCADCRSSWTEMRYVEGKWMDSPEWADQHLRGS
jgi:hypothetical protein